MTTRRTLLVGGAAVALLAVAGCSGGTPEAAPPAAAGPATLAITATGAAGMNPGPDGGDRPLTLTVLQLRDTTAFDAADFLGLQSPQAALGASLISATEVPLAPGGTATATVPLDPGATAVAVVGGFRDPSGKVFRSVTPVTAGASAALSVQVTSAGLTVGLA